MPEQWVILTAMEGEKENDLMGPFASRREAEKWMDANEPYLDSVVMEAIAQWALNGGTGDSPAVWQRICYLNHPSSVGTSE